MTKKPSASLAMRGGILTACSEGAEGEAGWGVGVRAQKQGRRAVVAQHGRSPWLGTRAGLAGHTGKASRHSCRNCSTEQRGTARRPLTHVDKDVGADAADHQRCHGGAQSTPDRAASPERPICRNTSSAV